MAVHHILTNDLKYEMLSLNRYKLLALLLSMWVASISATASSVSGRTLAGLAATADSAWKAHDYTRAAKYYEECLNKNHENAKAGVQETAALHYNLANCYYRLKDYAQAVLHYERCLRLSPSDEDAAFNLELTRTKLTDRYDAPAEMFFVSWFRDFASSRSAAGWGVLLLFALLVCVLPMASFLLAQKLWVRKLSLSGVFVMGIVACFFLLLSAKQYQSMKNDRRAVVMRQVAVYESPTQSAHALPPLHEGTTVVLLDFYNRSWQQAELPDGRLVWIQSQPGDLVSVKE